MAAVFIPPSPRTSLNMSTRRPLANVPNATNSPHRLGLVPAKRPRTNALVDIPYGQPPPKKQIVDGTETEDPSPTRSRTASFQNPDSKLFTRRTNNAQPSAFERKLVAARDKERQSNSKGTRNDKPSAENLDPIRQWQRHYRKAFPQFVFYFDCIPEDVRSKCSRQVMALGAAEEKFFSRLVTHVVTSRPIPPEIDRRAPLDFALAPPDRPAGDGHIVQTVNPAVLEKNAEMNVMLSMGMGPKREQSQDVLHRAREMGMKIWAIEKLQRMIATINDAGIAGPNGVVRTNNTGGNHTKSRGKDDLSQVLQNELNGPSDRNHLSVLKELVMFKGPFIYIHDMDEKTRPVMVREYPKVAKRQDGIWPQFRSAPLGKCPFIEDPPAKRETDRQRLRQEKEKRPLANPLPVEHAQQVKQTVLEPAPRDNGHQTFGKESSPADERGTPLSFSKEDEANDPHQTQPISPRKSSESFIPPQLHRKGPFYHGCEPAASGLQPSNITSAIRSQMVSSTAAAPGAKAGLSKEVHELKRKVLEKSNGVLPTSIVPSSYRAPNAAPPVKSIKIQASRLGKPNTHDKLGNIEEEATQSEGTGTSNSRVHARKSGEQRKKERRRDPKPGYCENCRDKFDDFDEHIMTRKHRKYATNSANWSELDSLLFQLQRPLKEEYDYV